MKEYQNLTFWKRVKNCLEKGKRWVLKEKATWLISVHCTGPIFLHMFELIGQHLEVITSPDTMNLLFFSRSTWTQFITLTRLSDLFATRIRHILGHISGFSVLVSGFKLWWVDPGSRTASLDLCKIVSWLKWENLGYENGFELRWW